MQKRYMSDLGQKTNFLRNDTVTVTKLRPDAPSRSYSTTWTAVRKLPVHLKTFEVSDWQYDCFCFTKFCWRIVAVVNFKNCMLYRLKSKETVCFDVNYQKFVLLKKIIFICSLSNICFDKALTFEKLWSMSFKPTTLFPEIRQPHSDKARIFARFQYIFPMGFMEKQGELECHEISSRQSTGFFG